MTLCAGPGADGVRGSEQLRREPCLPGSGGMAAQCVEQVGLLHPVIDLVGDPQRLGEQGLRRCRAHRRSRRPCPGSAARP